MRKWIVGGCLLLNLAPTSFATPLVPSPLLAGLAGRSTGTGMSYTPDSLFRQILLQPDGPLRDGAMDGRTDGGREAAERAAEVGARSGRIAGRQAGFQGCSEQESRRQFDVGYSAGYIHGFHEYRRGVQTRLSAAQGAIIGEREARELAVSVDYPRGKQRFQDQQYAASTQVTERFTQNARIALSPVLFADLSQVRGRAREQNPYQVVPAPDYRFFQPHRTYGTAQENETYQSQYLRDYREGYARRYRPNYMRAYHRSFRATYERGCQEARQENFRDAYNRGFRLGQNQAYASPSADLAAIEEFEIARKAKFNQIYPKYAEEQTRIGERDAAHEFRLNPVRLLSATIIEATDDGVVNPGEDLFLKIRLRNFSASSITAADIKIRVTAENPAALSISHPEVTLARNLKPESLNEVEQVTGIRLNTSLAAHSARFTVTLLYRERTVSQETLLLNTPSPSRAALAETPRLPLRGSR